MYLFTFWFTSTTFRNLSQRHIENKYKDVYTKFFYASLFEMAHKLEITQIKSSKNRGLTKYSMSIPWNKIWHALLMQQYLALKRKEKKEKKKKEMRLPLYAIIEQST